MQSSPTLASMHLMSLLCKMRMIPVGPAIMLATGPMCWRWRSWTAASVGWALGIGKGCPKLLSLFPRKAWRSWWNPWHCPAITHHMRLWITEARHTMLRKRQDLPCLGSSFIQNYVPVPFTWSKEHYSTLRATTVFACLVIFTLHKAFRCSLWPPRST